jgi:hypothetical protein
LHTFFTAGKEKKRKKKRKKKGTLEMETTYVGPPVCDLVSATILFVGVHEIPYSSLGKAVEQV